MSGGDPIRRRQGAKPPAIFRPVTEDFLMNRNPATRASWCNPRAMRLGTAAFAFVISARPVFAQAVSGSVDPATGLNTLSTYVLGLVSAVMVIVAAWKGTHAFMEGRSIGPIAVEENI